MHEFVFVFGLSCIFVLAIVIGVFIYALILCLTQERRERKARLASWKKQPPEAKMEIKVVYFNEFVKNIRSAQKTREKHDYLLN